MTGDTADAPEQRFTVRIESDNDDDKLSFHKQVDGPTVAKIMSMIYSSPWGGFEPPVVRETATRYGAGTSELPHVSFPEFLDRLEANNNFQRLAAIALYHRDVLGDGHVSREELPKWFRKAGYPAPKNLWRDIRTAVRRGLIAEDARAEGFYYVTRKGESELRVSGGE